MDLRVCGVFWMDFGLHQSLGVSCALEFWSVEDVELRAWSLRLRDGLTLKSW